MARWIEGKRIHGSSVQEIENIIGSFLRRKKTMVERRSRFFRKSIYFHIVLGAGEYLREVIHTRDLVLFLLIGNERFQCTKLVTNLNRKICDAEAIVWKGHYLLKHIAHLLDICIFHTAVTGRGRYQGHHLQFRIVNLKMRAHEKIWPINDAEKAFSSQTLPTFSSSSPAQTIARPFLNFASRFFLFKFVCAPFTLLLFLFCSTERAKAEIGNSRPHTDR